MQVQSNFLISLEDALVAAFVLIASMQSASHEPKLKPSENQPPAANFAAPPQNTTSNPAAVQSATPGSPPTGQTSEPSTAPTMQKAPDVIIDSGIQLLPPA